MTREQLKQRVQGIGAVAGLPNAVENLGGPDGYTLLGETDIRLRDAFRRFRAMRQQIDAGVSRAVNAELAPAYTSNLQQLISEWV